MLHGCSNMNLTTIRQVVIEDRITTETIAQVRLDRFIANAVMQYSRYNPVITAVTLSTVADQAIYDLSAYNVLMILDCFWWPGGTITAELLSGSEQAFVAPDPVVYHQPSNRLINNINQSAQIKGLRGTWEQRNQTVVVYPTPTIDGDNNLEVIIGAQHILNVTYSCYDTIPADDLDIIADLATASYLSARASEMALEPDYKEGLQSITRHYAVSSIREAIEMLSHGVIAKYGNESVALVR